MIVAGVDPGAKGGVGILKDGQIDRVFSLPHRDKKVDMQEMWNILNDHRWPDLIVIEQQRIMSGQAGAMTIGANFGRIMGVVELMRARHKVVLPTVWNKAAQIPPKLAGKAKKEASFACALRTWGKDFEKLDLKPSQDGIVEALLIARYGA